ncbi:helicase associated domain-containing protein [Arthrobacter sp. PsM3]|uniref:helicase associated domain-containing protein n=1 Tax=Arthrobacter sp. PsM3 TaxID=3030531 RepID=UPI00263ABE58|nr:helicase associated domain-containing protein [Arthrobacter sp. PsM3]MDN4643441.1 helicase associated domain-containing protein [Arthrobacter sp. PsM3]
MDRRLRRAPDAEWVLMYRLGLSRKRIAELVRVHPAVVGYHLVIARRQDPGLETAHHAAAAARTSPSPRSLARMDEIIAWIMAEARLPRGHSENRGERSMARWLSDRRREAAEGTLDPAYRDGLARVPEWTGNHRAIADEARWHDRLAELVDFRAEGNDWPRHHDYASEREHTLGVWIHAQRYKRRRGDLDPAKVMLLDQAAPGWQTGRKRGRTPRRRPVPGCAHCGQVEPSTQLKAVPTGVQPGPSGAGPEPG